MPAQMSRVTTNSVNEYPTFVIPIDRNLLAIYRLTHQY